MRGNRFLQILLTNIHLCLIELFSNKTRSFITSFGIFIGAVSLLANIASVRAIDNDVKENMERIGGLNIITIKKKEAADSRESRTINRSPGLTTEDALELQSRFGYIQSYLPHIQLQWGPASANGKKAWSVNHAVGQNYFKAYKIEIDKGRNFSESDHLGMDPVCIIGTRVASRLFGEFTNPVGKVITLNKVNFVIIGTLQADNKFSWRTRQIFFPYNFYKKKFSRSDRKVNELIIELKNSSFTSRAKSDFTQSLLERHRGIPDFEIETNTSKIKEMKSASRGIQIILYCIAGISLFIGGISIMNIMFAAIGDRIREIGVRKALGASKTDIILQFLIEATILCLIGGVPGMLLGGAVTLFPEGFFPFNPSLLASDYLISIMFIICTGLVSGIIPAIKASNMQPAEALRY